MSKKETGVIFEFCPPPPQYSIVTVPSTIRNDMLIPLLRAYIINLFFFYFSINFTFTWCMNNNLSKILWKNKSNDVYRDFFFVFNIIQRVAANRVHKKHLTKKKKKKIESVRVDEKNE